VANKLILFTGIILLAGGAFALFLTIGMWYESIHPYTNLPILTLEVGLIIAGLFLFIEGARSNSK